MNQYVYLIPRSEPLSTLLDQYLATFAGYGNHSAAVWFIGMEEGGGRDVNELQRRLAAWDARGRQPLEDLSEFRRAFGEHRYFTRPFKLQPTWKALTRTLLVWQGVEPTDVRIREVQSTELGTAHGQSTIAELFPLPARSVQVWPYESLAPLRPELVDRDAYFALHRPLRIQMLQTLLNAPTTRAIVCYGKGYDDNWATLLNLPMVAQVSEETRWNLGSRGGIPVATVPHPVSRGIRTAFWNELGARLRDESLRS